MHNTSNTYLLQEEALKKHICEPYECLKQSCNQPATQLNQSRFLPSFRRNTARATGYSPPNHMGSLRRDYPIGTVGGFCVKFLINEITIN